MHWYVRGVSWVSLASCTSHISPRNKGDTHGSIIPLPLKQRWLLDGKHVTASIRLPLSQSLEWEASLLFLVDSYQPQKVRLQKMCCSNSSSRECFGGLAESYARNDQTHAYSVQSGAVVSSPAVESWPGTLSQTLARTWPQCQLCTRIKSIET